MECLVILILVGGYVFLAPLVYMWAWNFVVPALFHGPAITYWQTFALSLLIGAVGGAFRSLSSSK